mgnify:CR=1 FL=1
MTIEITNKSGELVPTESVRDLLQNAIIELKLNPDCELNLVFVDIEEMTELHIKWMDEGGPTDVLSFPMDEMKPNSAANGPGVVGDIVLCPTYAAKNGKQPVERELELLAVHGVLHLLGYDHEEIEDEVEMFALQEKILGEWRALK